MGGREWVGLGKMLGKGVSVEWRGRGMAGLAMLASTLSH